MKLLERWATRSLKRMGYDVVRNVDRHPERRPSFPSDAFEAQRKLLEMLGRSENPMIFDVGANHGQTATRYRSVFPGADIVCFEPFPESMEKLQRTHANDGKVRAVPLAVGRERGTATFHVNQMSGTNSLFPRPSSSRRYFEAKAAPKTTIEVDVTTLDAFLREQNLATID
ncbi:MAG TPA: FkbM family methyltransferase, partial [Planctomycetaceae bacterium]|nr:FkbM family methyltransferase [Planctomycetaceae bacterium]